MKTKVLVTGAGGQLGMTIKAIEKDHREIDFHYKTSKELDVTNEDEIGQITSENSFDYIINCAAYTKVDLAEKEINQAFQSNVLGAESLAKACLRMDCTLIHISTDFVFEGNSQQPYAEDDSVNPINTYGKTKLEGERRIINFLNKHYIIRTSWLYSEFGNNFLKKMLQRSQTNDNLKVVSDQKGTPTYTRDLAEAIIKIIRNDNKKYGVYHFSNTGQTSWFDFAQKIFTFAGIKKEITPILTSEFHTEAKRPKYSVLNKQKIVNNFNVNIKSWEDSLKNALNNYFMKEELQTAIKASLKGGQAIMEVYNNTLEVEYKDDNSPLTQADKDANYEIVKILENTSIPIISEENKQIDYSTRKDWTKCWIVDPLDGTKEFIKKNGEFTVNIALVENGKPMLGVIYVPYTKTLYFADVEKQKASKAILEKNQISIDDILSFSKSISPRTNNEINIDVVGSRSHMNSDTLNFIEDIKKKGNDVNIVSKGSSLKFCLVAEGQADFYPRFAPTMEWDTAAGQAICNAVGVKVISQETNEALLYNKENLLNPWFLVSK